MPVAKRYFDDGALASSSAAVASSNTQFKRKSDERPSKKPFQPKEGFIAAGLKAYAETAQDASSSQKERLSEGWKDRTTTQTTLFLTKIPPNLTSPHLTLIFSAYAPLRSAFVVSASTSATISSAAPSNSANAISTGPGRDRTGKAKSRGFGYVRFVLRTDAEACLEEWGGAAGIPRNAVNDLELSEDLQGLDWDKICGPHGIKMGWAKRKLKEGEEIPTTGKTKVVDSDVDRVPITPPVDRSKRSERYDHAASRTVIVQGIPSASITNINHEQGDIVKHEDSKSMLGVEDEDGATTGESDSKSIDWKKALKQRAKKVGDVEAVNWPVVLPNEDIVATIVLYTPRQAHDLMKKLNNHVFRGTLISAAIKSTWDLVQRQGRAKGGGRLVVRNLGFDVNEADLRTVFACFGPLHSITLPFDAAQKPRGFAFIYYLAKSCAEAAMKSINGSRIYAGVAQDRIDSEGGKGGKKKEIREKKKQDALEHGGGGGERGRVVAVDWALSKVDWEKAQAEQRDDEGESKEDLLEKETAIESDEHDDKVDDETTSEAGTDDEPIFEETVVTKSKKDEVESERSQGTSLFVRNISFEATEPELYDLFKEFGPVRYARIVYDPTTKRSRGTAFVCFWNEESALDVLRASESLNAGLFGETSNKDLSSKSLVLADPGTSQASRISLHGRVLAAVLAVSKNDADRLREDRDKKGAAKTDRRNLYLMREGVIFPSWVVAQTLHPSDLVARQSSFDARKALLRSNPSLYISRTRLSIRQIPLYVSDGMLKRLANFAIKEFDKEVKQGLQKPLTSEEKDTSVVDASGAREIPLKDTRIKGVPPSKVRQAKILRQADRVDPLTGLGRSKGYGFLELGTHQDALKVLRWANANRYVGELFRTWWRETLEKMVEKVEQGAGTVGKGVQLKDRDERLKRLKEKMTELVEEEEVARGKAAKKESKGKSTGEGGRSSKCLIIEFSIENQLTTKRRAEKVERARERSRRTKSRDDELHETDGNESAERVNNKRKTAQSDPSVSEVSKKAKKESENKHTSEESGGGSTENRAGLSVGAIIGKKRRQQKGRK